MLLNSDCKTESELELSKDEESDEDEKILSEDSSNFYCGKDKVNRCEKINLIFKFVFVLII